MDKYSPQSVYENALLRDGNNNEYHGEALFMALILRASGERTEDNERKVAEIMDDQNLKE